MTMGGFGETVRELRDIRGYTQSQLAEMSGVSRHTISDIESGACDPQASTLTAVLNAMGMELRIGPIPVKPMKANTYGYDVKGYYLERHPREGGWWNGKV